jgi:HD-like signal output (HDOD) protein
MSSPPTVESLVDDVIQLVSLPDIYHKLKEAIADPDTSLDHIANLLAGDPDLTLRLLGIANSCLFGFSVKVDTLGRAISLIGTRQLRDIVMVTVVVKNLRKLDVELLDMTRFWQHSVSTGVIARAIATFRREDNIERYYAMGLLHDIGKILLYMKLPSEMIEVKRLTEESSLSQHIAEREILGFDHADLGGALLESWDLPDSLYSVIARHHNPMSAGEWVMDSSIVHAADVMANALNWNGCGQFLVPSLSSSAWGGLELPDSALPELVDRARQQYSEAVRLLLN